jgi:predicted TPR repeat methyltransferase
VDLSDAMMSHARDKNVYHELQRAELTAYLRDHAHAFDVIVSADTLVYFGDLEPVLAAAAEALRPLGRLVFTLEHAVDTGAELPYCLQTHGRYSHRRDYVEALLVRLGLDPMIAEAELRMEAGTPVAGLVIRATKPAIRTRRGSPRRTTRGRPARTAAGPRAAAGRTGPRGPASR